MFRSSLTKGRDQRTRNAVHGYEGKVEQHPRVLHTKIKLPQQIASDARNFRSRPGNLRGYFLFNCNLKAELIKQSSNLHGAREFTRVHKQFGKAHQFQSRSDKTRRDDVVDEEGAVVWQKHALPSVCAICVNCPFEKGLCGCQSE